MGASTGYLHRRQRKCPTVLREDFVWRLGNPQDLLNGPPARRPLSNIAVPATATPGRQMMGSCIRCAINVHAIKVW